MPDCRVIPCYKLFLKDLKEIMLTSPLNFALCTAAVSDDGEGSVDISPEVEIEHVSIKHHHHFPVSSTVVEAVNRGIQTNIRPDVRNYYCNVGTARSDISVASSVLNSRLVNGQVVSIFSSNHFAEFNDAFLRVGIIQF